MEASSTDWKIKKVIATFYLAILTLFLRIARYKVTIKCFILEDKKSELWDLNYFSLYLTILRKDVRILT